jgi:6-phosphogluconolactonase
MNIEVLSDADAVARRGAAIIAADARAAVKARGRFVFAVSGGRTPWKMMQALSREDVPWAHVHVMQADERIAPVGHADRNLTHLNASLLEHVPLPWAQVHVMPVDADDLEEEAAEYARTLADTAGTPPILDLVHLGLGTDGHTASLLPGDVALDERASDVAVTGVYDGRRRMTLTLPVINRARRVLWIVTGAEKADMLARMLKGDHSIPAGRVVQDRAVVLTDVVASAS